MARKVALVSAAGAVAWGASEGAIFVTGQVIGINGGRII